LTLLTNKLITNNSRRPMAKELGLKLLKTYISFYTSPRKCCHIKQKQLGCKTGLKATFG
jgi:hypothetical protein